MRQSRCSVRPPHDGSRRQRDLLTRPLRRCDVESYSEPTTIACRARTSPRPGTSPAAPAACPPPCGQPGTARRRPDHMSGATDWLITPIASTGLPSRHSGVGPRRRAAGRKFGSMQGRALYGYDNERQNTAEAQVGEEFYGGGGEIARGRETGRRRVRSGAIPNRSGQIEAR
jgi:hypothetical protein